MGSTRHARTLTRAKSYVDLLKNLIFIFPKRNQTIDFSKRIRGVARGEGGGKSPRNRKKLLQKNDVIYEGSIFSNNFSKNNKKFNFSILVGGPPARPTPKSVFPPTKILDTPMKKIYVKIAKPAFINIVATRSLQNSTVTISKEC